MSFKTYKLEDLLEIQNGFPFNSKQFSTEGNIGLIRIRDLKQGLETETRYSGEYDKKYIVKAGNYLIGMDGEFGCYEWKGEDALLNQRVCRLEAFSSLLDSRYLFYGINKYLKDIEDVTGFTTVKHISARQIREINFPVPSISEQKRIVAILDEAFAGIDQAIANTEKNLASARELFDEYLNSLKYDKFPLGDVVDIKTGKLNSNAAVEDGKYPFFTCSREIFAIDTYSFDCEAILLAGNNASGDFNVKHYQGKFDAYQRTYVITIHDHDKLLYRFFYFQMLKSLRELKNGSVGAGTKFLKLGMIKGLKIMMPPMMEQKEIVKKLEHIRSDTEHLEIIYQKKLDALKELKQSLLQKAFRGELTVDTNKVSEAAE